MRGVKEVSDNAIPPQKQMDFLAAWLDEIEPLLLASTWDNHAVEREEAGSGISMYQHIFSRRAPYFGGIGHIDLTVGQQLYTLAVSHVFQGKSRDNPLYGQQLYMRQEAPDREIAVAGDSHRPGKLQYFGGGRLRTAVNCGSLQTNSGYAKRYFSQQTQTAMPCLVLHPDQHIVNDFWTLDHAIAAGY
jgi:hypothetical protein